MSIYSYSFITDLDVVDAPDAVDLLTILISEYECNLVCNSFL